MIGALKRVWDNFTGGGEAAVTVPPMDGALRPNRAIEDAAVVLTVDAPDNLVSDGGRVWFSNGAAVHELDETLSAAREVHRFESDVTALAVFVDGGFAVGLDAGGVVMRGGKHDGLRIDMLSGTRLVCPTALMFAEPGQLLVAQGSASRRPDEWKHDVMERGCTGSVWRVDLDSGGATLLADRLAYPYGLARGEGGSVVISESWKHRLLEIPSGGGSPAPVLKDLPGYPSRLAACAESPGYWLTVFAPRSQLIEFVQREPAFRKRMIAEVEPAYWAAPSLNPSRTFLEPLQGGAQKHLGMLKPWAPTRSYGLAVRLDRNFRPLRSVHSRADGQRHGITSCVESQGRLLLSSKGGNVIVALDAQGGPA